MNTIKLICENCKVEFEREIKIYNYRQVKKKQLPFCNLSCSTIHRNKHTPKSSFINNGKRITQYANNKHDEFSQFRYFISKCKSRKKEYDLDLQYLKNLWETQHGICPYTGIKMNLPENTYSKTCNLKRASLDRIDSSLGYIKGNVEFVCLFINLAKNKYSKEKVIQFLLELKQ